MGRDLKTITTASKVIETVQDLDGARVAEVADRLNLAESTAHGYLSTLESQRFLVKEGDEYNIGMRFLNVGGYARDRKEGYKYTKRKVEELAEETGERAQFIVEEHGRGIYVHTKTMASAVEIDARIGKESYLHASSAGKAILAHLPERRRDEIIERWGLPSLTPNTVSSREALDQELEQIREQGYACNNEESISGLRAIGVPIKSRNDEVLGALSVSGPSNRMQGEEVTRNLAELLLGVANEIELKILYP